VRLVQTLLLTLLLACGPARNIEKEAAWKDVPLGVASGQVTGLVPISTADREAVFSREGEDKKWGKARIAVRYHFLDDRLWKVEVRTGDSLALLDALKAEYGTPPFSKPWTWEGERVRMHFQGHEYDSAAVVTIVDKPIEQEWLVIHPPPPPKPE